MMGLVKIRESGATPGLMKREWNRVVKTSWSVLGVYWHRNLLKKHFTSAGAKEYGYTPRKGESGSGWRGNFWGSYVGRKIRKFGHRRPLEYSGESRALTRVRDVRSTSKGVKVVIRAPKFNLRNRHSKINMADEVRRISSKEGDELTVVMDDDLDVKLNNLQTSEKRVI